MCDCRELGPCGIHPKACWVERVIHYKGIDEYDYTEEAHCTACEHERLAVAATLREVAAKVETMCVGVFQPGHLAEALLSAADRTALDRHDAEVRDRALEDVRREFDLQGEELDKLLALKSRQAKRGVKP